MLVSPQLCPCTAEPRQLANCARPVVPLEDIYPSAMEPVSALLDVLDKLAYAVASSELRASHLRPHGAIGAQRTTQTGLCFAVRRCSIKPANAAGQCCRDYEGSIFF